jgi:hypothetical protein
MGSACGDVGSMTVPARHDSQYTAPQVIDQVVLGMESSPSPETWRHQG